MVNHMLFHVVRYILLGPLLGAWIGLTQAVIAAAVWVAHGQPDFYFRGWQGVWLTTATLPLGGLIIGVPFGAAVAAWERKLSRRVSVVPGFICTIAVVAAATWAMVEFEYAREELLPAFWQEGVSVAIAAGLLLALSRRLRSNESLDQHGTVLMSRRDL